MIPVYDKREKLTSNLAVIQLSEMIFKMAENDVLNCRLTYGTEFEARRNKDGNYEIIRIIKESSYATRRFLLNSEFKESEYRMLGDEIMKHGGFWQVDFGGIATINLPQGCDLDIDEIFRTFNYNPTEIKD
jgi:hypothetical protein